MPFNGLKHNIASQLKKTGLSIAGVTAAVGTVGDFLNPLYPFCQYFFYASLMASTLALLSVLVFKKTSTKVLRSLLFSTSVMIFCGLMFLGQLATSSQDGVVATVIPGLHRMQSTLGIVQRDVAELVDISKRIEENTQESAAASREIAAGLEESTEQIVGVLEEIQQSFAEISSDGGIITNAARPEEHYHNARVYEMNGDYLNARTSYARYFRFGLEYIDPHLRYQRFLIVQEGRAGARETYAAIFVDAGGPTVELATILLLDGEARLERLRQYVAKYPDSAAGHYQLSREFSAARQGVQSLGEKQQELVALEAFVALNERGKLLKHFVDQEVAAEWLDDATERLVALRASGLLAAAEDRPVSVKFMRMGENWTAYLSLLELAEEVFYRLGAEGEFLSTGHTDFIDPKTGKPTPTLWFQFDPEGRDFDLLVKYRDINGETQGPFTVPFDRVKELCGSLREVLEMSGPSVAFEHAADIRFLDLLLLPEAATEIHYRWRWAAEGPSRQVFWDAQSAYYASSAESWDKYYDKPEKQQITPLEGQDEYSKVHQLVLWNQTTGEGVPTGWVLHPGGANAGDEFLSDSAHQILEFYYLDGDGDRHGPFERVPRGYAPFGRGVWGQDAISHVDESGRGAVPSLLIRPSDDMSDAVPGGTSETVPDLAAFEELCSAQRIHFTKPKKADLRPGSEQRTIRWLVVDWLAHDRPKYELPAVAVHFDDIVRYYSDGIARIVYGIDTETPDRELDLPTEPAAGWTPLEFEAAHTVYAPLATGFVTAKLVFLDGQESEVYTFHRFEQ